MRRRIVGALSLLLTGMRTRSVDSGSDVSNRKQGIETRVLLIIIGLATVTSYLLLAAVGRGDGLSTDDAMRLVQVRDFLAGQSWFDLTQYRLSPPGSMHWSRLIDVPLVVLIRAGEIVLPSALAERIAIVLWPSALLLLFLAGVARLARELAGDAAARLALIFTAAMAAVLQHFRPGAIDHHNAQLVLLVWSLALACHTPLRPREAAFAGAISALSLAIGVEMAPAIAALAAAMALHWIMRGETVKQATMAFALGLAAVMLGLFIATVPPAHYGIVTCDAFSIVHVAAACIGGIGLAVLAAVNGLASPRTRLAGAGALAALLAATLGFGFSACLGEPYAQLDPQLRTLWLSNVSEARSIVTMLRDLPHKVPHYYGLAVAALGLGLIQSMREQDDTRWKWIASLAVLAALFVVALWQVRGAAGANALAVALLPAALVRMLPASSDRPTYLGLSRPALIAALMLNPLSLIAIGAVSVRAVEAATGAHRGVVISDGPGTCRRAADYAPLARLPQGLVLGFIDAGPFLLMETPHAVLAAPYHRDIKGNAAMFDVFLGTPSEAAARIAALGVDYVAFCPGAPERYNYVASAPDGLAAALSRGEVPNSLERIALDGTDLAVFRPRR